MSDDKVREEFERWATGRGWSVGQLNGFYDEPCTSIAWSAWQASRCEIRVNLPELYPFHRKGITDALLAHGIRVKIWSGGND